MSVGLILKLILIFIDNKKKRSRDVGSIPHDFRISQSLSGVHSIVVRLFFICFENVREKSKPYIQQLDLKARLLKNHYRNFITTAEEQLIDIPSDRSLRMTFSSLSLLGFWNNIKDEYPGVADKTLRKYYYHLRHRIYA